MRRQKTDQFAARGAGDRTQNRARFRGQRFERTEFRGQRFEKTEDRSICGARRRRQGAKPSARFLCPLY
ncbi:MAG: hypothetical protein LBD06_03245 [Candidatus Accumulibacter sp.]|nr:hypothetical protein [Accumulibacter sp.]